MKTNNLTTLLMCFLLALSINTFAQLNTPRGSQQATVSQRVGISDVSITYSRPSVKGREVWGKLVPYGMNNLGFGTSTEAPWRAGANENTTITFTHHATVEGQPINAGTYGLHIEVIDADSATLILSKEIDSWGSYFYDKAHDALRAKIKMNTTSHRELLTYEFNTVNKNATIVSLVWEKKEFPFEVKFDVTNIVLNDFRGKSKGNQGFNRQNWETMAAFSLNNDGDLNEALKWIDGAISGNFYSQKTYNNLQIKSQILNKLDKKNEADMIMTEALELATVFEIHQYGRTLLAQGEKQKALGIFKVNAKKNKDTWPVHYGLARGYSALGEYKKALSHLKIALNNAPNEASKGRVRGNIAKLESNQDIN